MINKDLAKEILDREGEDAAISYLMDTEKLSLNESELIIKDIEFGIELAPTDFQAMFDHYCCFCNRVWNGVEGSLCRRCKTDGYNNGKSLPLKNKIIRLFKVFA